MTARVKSLTSLALTLGVCGIFVLWMLGSTFRPDGAKKDGYDLETLRRVPVVDGGRIKPMDTFARTILKLNSGSEQFETKDGETLPAIRWLMESMAAQLRADSTKQHGIVWTAEAFKIDNDQILAMLGLKAKSGFRYALKEFVDKLDVLEAESIKARKKDKDSRELVDVKLIELSDRLGEFLKVNHLDIRVLPPTTPGGEWESVVARQRRYGKMHAVKAQKAAFDVVLKNANIQPEQLRNLNEEQMAELDKAQRREFVVQMHKLIGHDQDLKNWQDLVEAYQNKEPARFNKVVAALAGNVDKLTPFERRAAKLEVFYNRFAPFYDCTGMYVVAAGLAAVGLMLFGANRQYAPLALWPAWGLLSLALLIHTFGLLARCYIQWRPPVTNLYSSAIFIGWGCVLLCLILERVYPTGIVSLVGSVLGFLTTVIAHNLGSDRDTLEMMQAVLDTNFWLATHVTIITSGYVATYVAGFLGMIFILLGVFTSVLDRKTFKALGGVIYGVVCFATLLSFVGTVLGGIWADYSWGRFWGWDPKENGALLIVLWNAIVLHARWGGMVKQRGVAVLTVLGCMVVTWSWFGTNMLGVGLHAYASADRKFLAIGLAYAAWMIVVIIGATVPTRNWRSYGGQFDNRPPSEPKPEPGPKPRVRERTPVAAT